MSQREGVNDAAARTSLMGSRWRGLAGVLSRLGEVVLQRYGIVYTYEQLVDRIHGQTEELLAQVEDPEVAYRLVKARAGR